MVRATNCHGLPETEEVPGTWDFHKALGQSRQINHLNNGITC